ncbi:hypothetical protein MRX96_036117 [Rhipicephalus microplus]
MVPLWNHNPSLRGDEPKNKRAKPIRLPNGFVPLRGWWSPGEVGEETPPPRLGSRRHRELRVYQICMQREPGCSLAGLSREPGLLCIPQRPPASAPHHTTLGCFCYSTTTPLSYAPPAGEQKTWALPKLHFCLSPWLLLYQRRWTPSAGGLQRQ